jgi:hypothetical protein
MAGGMGGQPWIHSAAVDLPFLLAPALLITALVVLCQDQIAALTAIPPWLWLLLIPLCDVGHVYATLFRTYADPEERRANAGLYLIAPLLCWAVGTVVYLDFGAHGFWRALSYLAAFHFVRQQYGFMMIYARGERAGPLARGLDQAAIYLATLYPLLYWHTHLPRGFNWFIQDGFIPLPWAELGEAAGVVYGAILLAYGAKEVAASWRRRRINWPKNLMLLGTALSWGVGICVFDNDLTFTATNVITHGVPYIALIWIYGHQRGRREPGATLSWGIPCRRLFAPAWLPVYIGVLVLLGYLEEGLWDGFIWTEHPTLFGLFGELPQLADHPLAAYLVPLLALPQMVHYVLDAFIWRLHTPTRPWRETLFFRPGAARPDPI